MSKILFFDGNDAYSVKFDVDEIKEFREEVINKTSRIIHHDYVGTKGPYSRRIRIDPLEIRNYTFEAKGENEYGEKMFHFVYDEYIFPYLAKLLNELTLNDPSALIEILEPNFSKEYVPMYDRLEKLVDSISKKGYDDDENRLVILNDIVHNLNEIKYSGVNIPVSKYYTKALTLIHIQKDEEVKKLFLNEK